MPRTKTQITLGVLGLGTVGSTLAQVLAERVVGSRVLAHDPDVAKKTPRGVTRAAFADTVADSQMLFLCLPTHCGGRAFAGHGWRAICESIRRSATTDCILVLKSTLSPGDADELGRRTGLRVVVCPEFLSEGSAYRDMRNPHRVILGGTDSGAVHAVYGLLREWIPARRIIRMDMWSAQLAKLAANAFLAQRVASINSLVSLCEKAGGDIGSVAKAVGLDPRIGSLYLRPSAGIGGSCLEKDIRLLADLAAMMGLGDVARYWRSILVANEAHIRRGASLVSRLAGKGKGVALLGIAFKAGTADTRNSAALRIAGLLDAKGHVVCGMDPLVTRVEIRSVRLERRPQELLADVTVLVVFHGAEVLAGLAWQRALRGKKLTVVDFSGTLSSERLPIGLRLVSVGSKESKP